MEQEFSEFCKFRESDKPLKHDWSQFKYLVSYMCFADAMVASWSPTQKVADSYPFIVVTNSLSLNSVKTFRGKLNCRKRVNGPFLFMPSCQKPTGLGSILTNRPQVPNSMRI